MTYDNMKDSGIPWVGVIPFDWLVLPAGQIFHEVKEKNTDNRYQNAFSFRYGEIVDKKITGALDDEMEETLSAYRIVTPDTIMLNGLNLNYDFISQRVAIVRKTGIITSAYLAVKPDESKILPLYALYLLKAYDYRQVLHSIGSGIRKTLKYQDFKKLKVIVPDLTSQAQIVIYIDRKRKKIDAIIREAKAAIEEYKRWKASIIYQAVTKGLDPNALMKESGVSWIGETPAHWKTPSLKYLCSMQAGKNLTSEEIAPTGDFPVYGGNGLRGFYNAFNREGEYLLVGRQGALCGNVHRVSGKFWATEHAVVTTPADRARFSFLHYLLIGMNLNQYASNTAAQPGLSVSTVLNVRATLPPLNEQEQISLFLDEKVSMIDAIMMEKQSLIMELESYKKSLIYEAVTGKRRVV